MVHKCEGDKPSGLADWAVALNASLAAGAELLAAGEAGEAERMAKAVSALAKAVRDVAALEAGAHEHDQEDDVEAIRAELRRRVARYADAAAAGASLEELERLAREGAPE